MMDESALGARMARGDANYNRDSKRRCVMTEQQGGSSVPVGSGEDRVGSGSKGEQRWVAGADRDGEAAAEETTAVLRGRLLVRTAAVMTGESHRGSAGSVLAAVTMAARRRDWTDGGAAN